MSIIIYHNPHWSKSRESLKILNNLSLDFKIIEYLKEPLTEDELKSLSKKLKLPPKNFIRRKDTLFKKLDLSSFIDNEKVLFKYMSENPRLIERPIIVRGDKAILGRPIENVKTFFWLINNILI